MEFVAHLALCVTVEKFRLLLLHRNMASIEMNGLPRKEGERERERKRRRKGEREYKCRVVCWGGGPNRKSSAAFLERGRACKFRQVVAINLTYVLGSRWRRLETVIVACRAPRNCFFFAENRSEHRTIFRHHRVVTLTELKKCGFEFDHLKHSRYPPPKVSAMTQYRRRLCRTGSSSHFCQSLSCNHASLQWHSWGEPTLGRSYFP